MLESLWREDFTLHSLNALRQYWQEGESYTFRRSPRPQHGLMLLTGGETLYETRAGERLHARCGDLVYLSKGSGYTARFVNVTARPYSLLVNFQLTNARGEDVSGGGEVTLLPLRGAEAEAPMRRLVDLYYDPDYAPAEMKGRLYELICLASRRLSGKSGVPPELAAAFDLGGVLGKRAGRLSGGWQRRLSLAMALIGEPEILFLDEPTLGLDVIARAELWDVIRALRGRVTVILTTHYMEEAEALSDRIAVMKSGRVLAEGTAEALKARAGCESFEDAFIALVRGEGRAEQ